MKQRTWLLIVTALIEVGTGFFLLFLPSIPLALLLGIEQAAPEAVFISRLAGAALFALGVICFLARSDDDSAARRSVVNGMLIYNIAAAVLLAYAGTVLSMGGIALWPAVLLHTALAIWCGMIIASSPPSALRQI